MVWFFFFKQKTAYGMRISDWSVDVCSSDLTSDTLRRRRFAGVWPSGQRLEAARLATELGVSMTPVRDSLNRLAGERLVHSSPGEGFQVPLLSETEPRALIDWHRALVGIALGRRRTLTISRAFPQGHEDRKSVV